MDDMTGRSLGPFRIDKALGQGAMGAVYRATHLKSGKAVALKVMLDPGGEDSVAARFRSEIGILAGFRGHKHANFVRFIGSGEDDGVLWYAMDLVDGQSLEQELKDGKRLSLKRTVAYGVQLCEALKALHGVGIVHRDLKPANIMVGKDRKVRLTDFGIAKDFDTRQKKDITQADHTVGTIAYMSPEQITGGEVTGKSDLYALGILLFRMATGRLPFLGETMYQYVQQRMECAYPKPTSVNPHLPVEFDRLIDRLLTRDAADRPRDAYVVYQSLLDLRDKPPSDTLEKTAVGATAGQGGQGPAVPSGSLKMHGRFGTLLSVITGGIVQGDGAAKRKKRGRVEVSDVPAGPWHESPWVLVLALAAVLGVFVYAFWPLGAEQKIARAETLMANPYDYGEARELLDEVVAADAAGPAGVRAEQLRTELADRIALQDARTEFKRADRKGQLPPDAGVAERAYWKAHQAQVYGNVEMADRLYGALVDEYQGDPDHHGWSLLAERSRESLAREIDLSDREAVLADTRAKAREQLVEARQLQADGKIAAAFEKYENLELLFRDYDDETIAGIVADARAELAKAGGS